MILGLLISIPIVVFGSQFVLKLVECWPFIIQIGAGVLPFTAAQMIVQEPFLDPVFDGSGYIYDISKWVTYSICIAGVLLLGWFTNKRQNSDSSTQTIST